MTSLSVMLPARSLMSEARAVGRRSSRGVPLRRELTSCSFVRPCISRKYSRKASQSASVSFSRNSFILGSGSTLNFDSKKANLSFAAVIPALV